MSKHRARLFLLVLGVSAVATMTGAFVTNAPASSPPSVAGVTSLVGAPSALACNGAVNVKVTLTGTAGVDGTATETMLTLDLSGSMSEPKFSQLKSAATALVQALDAGDGADNGTLGLGNRVGILTYRGTSTGTTVVTALTDQESTLTSAINALPNPTGASPHAAGIGAAQTALGVGSGKKAIVLVSDGISSNATEATNAAAAAAAAKTSLITIATIGIGSGSGVNQSDLTSWASPNAYQYGTPGPIDAAELVKDVGVAVSVPAAFTLTETPGANFSLGSPSTGGIGSLGVGPGNTWSGTWSGSLANGQVATLDYTATRNGTNLFSVTSETVSTSALAVTGGSATIAPATRTIDVLPCDAGALLAKQTCTGAACTAGGTTNGLTYSLNAGSPGAGTEIFVAGLTSTPPAGACPGFDTNTNGVQIDIRPLTTPGNFEIRIPKAALGNKKWWQTDVCVGTNLRFITKIGSLANLRPGALNSGDRWWGLLPSVPRYVYVPAKPGFPALGWVKGPSVTFRGSDGSGGAVIRFTVPFVGDNSKNYTTNSLPGYDPRAWGG